MPIEEFNERIHSENWEIKQKHKDHRVDTGHGKYNGLFERIDGRAPRKEREPKWTLLLIRLDKIAFLAGSFMVASLSGLVLNMFLAAAATMLIGCVIALTKSIYTPIWEIRNQDLLLDVALVIVGSVLAVIT